jgi:hypothetical protein
LCRSGGTASAAQAESTSEQATRRTASLIAMAGSRLKLETISFPRPLACF